MTTLPSLEKTRFNSFDQRAKELALPEKFTFPFNYEPHPLSLLAVEQLQFYLKNEQKWQHNFGLTDDSEVVIGKMFGVLVVTTEENELGYLAAFSGKLAGSNLHPGFVPPLFDGLENGSFLNEGMTAITRMNEEISFWEECTSDFRAQRIAELKAQRKTHSTALQNQIFEQYHFLNKKGVSRSLRDIFTEASYKNPPAGAGECAAPKLLQYAFQNNMKPIALAEFWWGLSPKSAHWKHGHFYPCCQEKCAPILVHMLSGMEIDSDPELEGVEMGSLV